MDAGGGDMTLKQMVGLKFIWQDELVKITGFDDRYYGVQLRYRKGFKQWVDVKVLRQMVTFLYPLDLHMLGEKV
jgi:hypothetical protein